MTAYVSKPTDWNVHSTERKIEKICGSCSYEESKRTGVWRSPVTVYERVPLLESYSKLVKRNGSKGEMVARVPLDTIDIQEIHRKLSHIQAKQEMETCGACNTMLRKIFEGEIPVDESFAIA